MRRPTPDPSPWRPRLLRRRKLIALVLLPLLAAAADSGPQATIDSGLAALRQADTRVATITYRLATANLALCPDKAPQAGLLLHDAAQYRGAWRAGAERLFGLKRGPGVTAVVPGGPADRAGLEVDDILLSINGQPVARQTRGAAPSYQPMDRLIAQVDAQLARGALDLAVLRGAGRRDIHIIPTSGCGSAVQMRPAASANASADGRLITVDSALVDFAPDDNELAVLIAHEMAHNALRHRARLDAQGLSRGLFGKVGRNARLIRQTEREADHVGLWMLARAGYDIHAAPRFWERYGRAYGLGPFAFATHPDWRKRVRALDTAIRAIEAQRGSGAPLLPTPLPPED